MTDTATGSAASGDSGTADYQAKYDGLMRVFNKRTDELTTAQQAAAEHQGRVAELETELEAFRSRDRAAQEESQLEAQYTALRARFEPEPPTPRSPSQGRPGRAAEPDPFAQPESRGYPV